VARRRSVLKPDVRSVDVPVVERAWGRLRADDDGFTIVEMVVAMTLLALAMMGLAQIMYGAMSAHVATQQRSVFLELATAEMESLRATPYAATCVTPASGVDTEHDGLLAATGDASTCAVSPRTPVATTPTATSHDIRRWVTWTDATGARVPQGSPDATLKRLSVELRWDENNKTPRKIRLTSIRYPGGFGRTGAPPGPNKPPVAKATSNAPFIAQPLQAITFDGSTSTDDAGPANLRYSWSFGDGTTATGAVVTKSFTSGGSYEVVLTVRDQNGAGDPVSVSLSVVVVSAVSPNAVPVTNVTASCHADTQPIATPPACALVAYAPLGVTFDATTSSDADDDDLFFTWSWGDGTPVEGGWSPVRSHTFVRAQTHQVVVTAHDLKGGSMARTVPVRGLPLNCEVTSGALYNGNRTEEDNYIRLKNNNSQAWTSSITFTATSNTACKNLRVRLPIASGQLLFTGLTSTLSADGSTLTWTSGLRSFANSTQFHIGTQTVEFIPDHPDLSRPSGALAATFTAATKSSA
jgi:prepilin-type N-terminal cleavage/methylation domain-containing protein